MTTSKRPTLATAYRPEANSLNAIRLVLATMVIASHSYPIAFGLIQSREPLARVAYDRSEFGAVAVDGFFALSGFLLTSSWGRSRGVADFARRRLLRIYPAFVICVLACIVIVGPLTVPDVRSYFRNPLTYRLLKYLYLGRFWNELPYAFAQNPVPGIIDSSLWTIKYELYCYGLLVVWGCCRLLQPRPTLAFATTLLIFYAGADRMGLSLPLGLAPSYMPRLTTFFFAGAALYLWRNRVPMRADLFMLGLILCCTFPILRSWQAIVLPTAGLYCLFYIGTRQRPVLNRIGRSNDLSYGIYLYAWPIQQLLCQYCVGPGRPWTLTAATLPVVAVVAAASWVLIERPALRLKWFQRHGRSYPGTARAQV